MGRKRTRRTAADRRELLFQRGADALSLISPHNDAYCCPCCLRIFGRDALSNRLLTLEHVPPKSQGGKPIALTCRECNSTAGHLIDAALEGERTMRALGQLARGAPPNFEQRVKLTGGGIATNAIFKAEDGKVTILVKAQQNHPDNFHTQTQGLRNRTWRDADGVVRFHVGFRFGFKSKQILASHLRSAYIAAFALLGYSYIARDALDRVRLQFSRPDSELISGAWWSAPTEFNRMPGVMLVTAPLQMVLVVFRELMVALPWLDGSQEFYDQVSSLFQGQPRCSGQLFEFPQTMAMIWDALAAKHSV